MYKITITSLVQNIMHNVLIFTERRYNYSTHDIDTSCAFCFFQSERKVVLHLQRIRIVCSVTTMIDPHLIEGLDFDIYFSF